MAEIDQAVVERASARQVIAHIADVANAVAWQAGVGGMETAGSIVSYLAKNPDAIPGFMERGSVLDWPSRWHVEGCLTWHGANGGIYSPEDVKLTLAARQLATTEAAAAGEGAK